MGSRSARIDRGGLTLPGRLVTLGSVLAVSAGFAPAVAADPPPEQREADERFQEGKALMEQGAIPEACAKLARSLELYRRGGTLLNLAVCREKEGRIATAFTLFQDALAVASADGRTEREEIARDAIERLRARLSWLTVSPAPGAADLSELVISRDGAPLPRDVWGALVPVDPGAHTITASAAGRQRFEITVTVADDGDRRTVEIPVLAPEPPPAPIGTGTGAGAKVPVDTASASAVAPPPGPTWKRPAGIAGVAAGAAAIALGAAFGVKAILDSRESEKWCPSGRCTTDEALARGTAANQDARAAALVSDVALPVGALLAGAAVYLLVTAPAAAPPPKSTGVRAGIAPILGPDVLGMSLGGTW